VSHFETLHPALQHHIVNSLGWRELRPFQDAVIPAILAGKHLIILAPTAGGKTEAAFFPVLADAVRRVTWTQCPVYLSDQGAAQQPRHPAAAVL
jgi:Lhr-like helicase